MKGFLDLFILLFLLIILVPFILIGPDVLKYRIQAQYIVNIQTIVPTDILLSILSATNSDKLNNNNQKPTIEILGERILIPSQDTSFLRTDLDKLVKSKCYLLETEKFALVDSRCSDIAKKQQDAVPIKLVIPFNSAKLVENIKLVVK